MRSRSGTPSRMFRPRTFAVPAVGWRRLRSSRRNVVLPAPFGPTSPIAPSGIATERSSTARTSPNTLVRFLVSTSPIVPSTGRRSIGRGRRRCRLSDSRLSASPEHDREDGPRHDRDDKEREAPRNEPRRRSRSERVGLQSHLPDTAAVLVRLAFRVVSVVVCAEVRYVSLLTRNYDTIDAQ